MKLCADLLRACGEGSELHIINRLDKVVGGLVLFARNRESAAALSAILSDGIVKEYRAVAEGEVGVGIMRDFIYKDSTLGRAFVTSAPNRGAKEALLEYETLESVVHKGKTLSLVKVALKTGRFHQIRAQFSSRKMPLVGDKKYGSRDFGARTPSLFASRLAFEYKSESFDIRALPVLDAYPWSLFNKDNFEE